MDDRNSAETAADHPCPARRRWMAILARAEAGQLRTLLDSCGGVPSHTIVRGPESGLVMVRGRAGGGGAAFNLGEMSVTRCSVRTDAGLVGHSYVAGREEERALLAALGDALMQDPDRAELVERCVVVPLEREQDARRAERAARAGATRVQFFAMQTMRT